MRVEWCWVQGHQHHWAPLGQHWSLDSPVSRMLRSATSLGCCWVCTGQITRRATLETGSFTWAGCILPARPFLHHFPDGVLGNTSLTELKVPRGLTGLVRCPPAERTFQLHLNHQKTLNTKIAPSARRAPCCSSLSKQLYKLRSKKVGWGKALFKTARATYEKLPKQCLPRWSPRCSPSACTMHRKTMMEQVQAEEQKKNLLKISSASAGSNYC